MTGPSTIISTALVGQCSTQVKHRLHRCKSISGNAQFSIHTDRLSIVSIAETEPLVYDKSRIQQGPRAIPFSAPRPRPEGGALRVNTLSKVQQHLAPTMFIEYTDLDQWRVA